MRDWDTEYVSALLAPKRVLFVDDDPWCLTAAEEASRKFHVKCVTCAEPVEAVELVKREAVFDLVFCDVRVKDTVGRNTLIAQISAVECPARLVMMSYDAAPFPNIIESNEMGIVCFMLKTDDLKACFKLALKQTGCRELASR